MQDQLHGDGSRRGAIFKSSRWYDLQAPAVKIGFMIMALQFWQSYRLQVELQVLARTFIRWDLQVLVVKT